MKSNWPLSFLSFLLIFYFLDWALEGPETENYKHRSKKAPRMLSLIKGAVKGQPGGVLAGGFTLDSIILVAREPTIPEPESPMKREGQSV